MKIYYSSQFKRQYKKLEPGTKDSAEAKEAIFRTNPFHSRLKTHKLHGKLKNFWAFWVDNKNRIIFKFVDEGLVEFYQIGDHDIYE